MYNTCSLTTCKIVIILITPPQHRELCDIRGRNGFTLIELSLVITIIGLLIGGVFLSNDLVRQFKLRSVLTDFDQFQSAILTFKIKYNGLPGDITNATNFWGTNPNCNTGTVGTGTETCNGNGNSAIDLGGPSQVPPREQFYVWQHLVNAGLIRGAYTGVSDFFASCYPNINCPGGRMSEAQAYFISTAIPTPTTNWWPNPLATAINIGVIASNQFQAYPAYPILSPQEALGLDTKADDGKPGTGFWRTFGPRGYSSECAVNGGTLAAIADAAAEQDVAIYTPNSTNILCSMLVYIRI